MMGSGSVQLSQTRLVQYFSLVNALLIKMALSTNNDNNYIWITLYSDYLFFFGGDGGFHQSGSHPEILSMMLSLQSLGSGQVDSFFQMVGHRGWPTANCGIHVWYNIIYIYIIYIYNIYNIYYIHTWSLKLLNIPFCVFGKKPLSHCREKSTKIRPPSTCHAESC